MIIGKMSGILATQRFNGKKSESSGKMTETTKHIYEEAIRKSDQSIVAVCHSGK